MSLKDKLTARLRGGARALASQDNLERVRRMVRKTGFDVVRHHPAPPDFDDDAKAILARVAPFTMTSPQRIFAATQAARYVIDAGIDGAIVECGVWRGGSSMAMALASIQRGDTSREFYLFDTYEGMSAPTAEDTDVYGTSAAKTFEATRTGADSSAWCLADLDDVRRNVDSTGYDPARVHYGKGKVEETLPGQAPEKIALLRLDTDWYASTKHELETLYPRLVPGGVLIIDDYGHWQGSRKAVDDYLAANHITLLLGRIDDTGRMAVKPG